MRWKTTVVLLIATIGLGAYVSLYDLRRPTREEQETRSKQVINLTPEDVRRLTVELGKTRLVLESSADGWRLTEPVQARADSQLVQQLLAHLQPLTAERMLALKNDQPLTPSQFGLDPAKGTLTIESNSGITTLRFGEATPVGHHQYASLGDQTRIAVIGSELFDALNRSIDGYRSHALIDAESWQVNDLSIESPKGAYRLMRRGDQWELTAPIHDEADPAAASALLKALEGLRAVRFVMEQPQAEGVREWGFDEPAARVVVGFGQVRGPIELFIGREASDRAGERYVKRADEATIATMQSSAMEPLVKDLASLRSRQVFGAFAGQVTACRVEWQGRTWAIEKHEGQWREAGQREAERTGGAALDADLVDKFLWKLHELRIERFIEDASLPEASSGLEPPAGRVILSVLGEDQPKELQIGSLLASSPHRYGRLLGRPGLIELPAGLDELLPTSPSAFAPAAPPAPSASTANPSGQP